MQGCHRVIFFIGLIDDEPTFNKSFRITFLAQLGSRLDQVSLFLTGTIENEGRVFRRDL